MKDNPQDADSLDELFAQELKHLEVAPKQQNWEDIQENLDGEHFDQVIKHRFQDFERSPSNKIWDHVETQIPLNLRLRNQLQWLSKIAAVLVLGMFAFYLFVERPTQSTLVEITPQQVPVQFEAQAAVLASSEEKEPFVFDIPATKTTNKSNSKAAHKTQKAMQEEADDFLASILLDEDEFGEQINEQKMAEILLPIEQLPIENIAAMLVPMDETEKKEATLIEADENSSATASKEIDLQITIPLKVVEENEVEGLINYYDQQQLKKKSD